ncbi:hypothetical protein CPLU01_14248 [Colletotrichum plurivorum]|uniref:Uncharacterized protein n=1 Tax=Colletotrichum plurivorum TaxID=2175906 RepID=A0A8H6JKR1_9PEZI|nr:hypothetical protein CPLU01_14248 [Colletotrichum plurivorum]
MYQPANRAAADQSQRDCAVVEQEVVEQAQEQDPDDSQCGSNLQDPVISIDRQKTQLSMVLKGTMAISLLALASAASFITWLWWAPRDGTSWRSWVLAENRTQLSITFASLIIRTAIGVLASVATAMIASVVIERHGVSLQAVAQLSITRYASSGPLSLGPLVLKDPILDTRARVIILLLILTTLSTQFTSSLLTLDLEGRDVVSLPQTIPTFRVPALRMNGLHWQRSPFFAHAFAEHSEVAKPIDGVDDTGTTIRALLPIAAQTTREKLRDFQGMARIIDSRVACMRPEILDFWECEDTVTNGSSVCGKARLDKNIVRSIGLGFQSYDAEQDTFEIRCPFEPGFPAKYAEDLGVPPVQPSWALCWPPQSNDEAKKHDHLNISLTSSNSRTELRYDGGKNQVPSPITVSGQLGISKVSNTQGGMGNRHGLRIKPESLEASLSEARREFEMTTMRDIYPFRGDDLPQGNVAFCITCQQLNSYTLADPVFSQIMDEAREHTSSPARVVQALYFILSRLSYYENFNSFDKETARITTFERAVIPNHFGGYWTLMAILSVFLATFALTLGLFRETKYSIPENAWHTVAQISESPELRTILRADFRES